MLTLLWRCPNGRWESSKRVLFYEKVRHIDFKWIWNNKWGDTYINKKEEILKKIQTLYQSIQLLSQQIQAKEQEVTQKLQADQAESVQKVVNELIKAKKIKMLLNSQALLAFDRTDEKINLTPEVVDLINKEQKK